jgi:hypothetical protein
MQLIIISLHQPSDLELSESKIVSKLLVENKDNHDLDILNRIVAQIRTKLTFDLRERLNYEHIVAVKQRVYSYLKSGGNMLEDFVDVNDIKLTEIDTPDELAMFHMELARARGKDPANVQLNLSKTDHMLAMKELDVETRVKEAKEKIKELTLELENEDLSKNQRQNIELKIKLNEWRIKSLTNQDLSSYNNQEKAHLQKIANQEDIQELIRQEDLEHINMLKEQKIKANYVDRKPLLMVDPDLQKDYY